MDGLDVKSDLSIYEGTVSALHDKSNGGMILKKGSSRFPVTSRFMQSFAVTS